MTSEYDVYALPNMTHQGLLGLFQYDSEISGGIFFPVIILCLWVVTVVSHVAVKRNIPEAFVFASFIATMLSIPLAVLNLLAPRYMYLAILMTAFGALWYKLSSSRE